MGHNGHDKPAGAEGTNGSSNGSAASARSGRLAQPHRTDRTDRRDSDKDRRVRNFLRRTVEDLVNSQAAGNQINGESPAPTNGRYSAVDGQAVPNLASIFARTAVLPDGFRRIPRWKRIFDVTCIIVSLPLWLPLLLVLMAWIRFVSPGPVFYRQERIGYRRRHFLLFKFRTMHVNAETRTHEEYFAHLMRSEIPMTKLDAMDDNRLIRGGRLLRAIGLDELPQLFNVLRGEMSLVGPRPCLPNEFQRYTPEQQARVNALPGMTGYWQVNGKNRTTFSEMIAMDIYYAEHMSLWLDVKVICKTLPALRIEMLGWRRGRRNGSVRHAAAAMSQPAAQKL